MSLETITNQMRIAVTVGPGGVGKTTLAALLGLQAAVSGRKALVLTIDPAMRLADALGLIGITPGDHHQISTETLATHGIAAQVPLHVAMLDTGRSLTELIEREVPQPKRRERILGHPFFKRLCNDLAGSREYAAMEEVHHLHVHSNYDLLVVDTPPTTHSLQFLDAPDRILDVLEHNSYRWLMRPALLAGRLGLRVLDFSGGYVVRTLSRFTGLEFLKELASFVDLFIDLMEGFRLRAAALKTILQSQQAAFVLVTTPDPNQLEESRYLHRRLSNRNFSPRAVVANRVMRPPAPLPDAPDWRTRLIEELTRKTALQPDTVDRAVAAMEQAHRSLSLMAERDRACLEDLASVLGLRDSLVSIPMLPKDVHDLSGLEQLRKLVFKSL